MSLLKVTDAFCYICRGILIEPVTLPCYHVFCLICFEQSMHETSHCCPLCRKRISNWIRSAKKSNKLIDVTLWEKIQQQFTEQIRLKLDGEDDGLDQIIQNECQVQISVPKSGEVAQEFSKILANFRQENERLIEAQELASKEFIEKLKMEEEEKLQQIEREKLISIKQDEKLARLMQEEMLKELAKNDGCHKIALNTKPKSSNKGPMDEFLKNSSLNLNKGQSCNKRSVKDSEVKPPEISSPNTSPDSIDSLRLEMNLFKPIKTVLRTPPKRYPDGRISEINLKKVTPMKLVSENSSPISRKNNIIKGKSIHSVCSAFVNALSVNRQSHPEMEEDEKQAESLPKRLKFSPDVTDIGILKDITLEENNDSSSACSIAQEDLTTMNMSKHLDNNFLFPVPVMKYHSKNKKDEENDMFETQDYLNPSPILEEKLIEEQKRIEKIILQEKKDRELAMKLSQEWAREVEPQRKPQTRSMKAKLIQNKKTVNVKKIQSSQKTLTGTRAVTTRKRRK